MADDLASLPLHELREIWKQMPGLNPIIAEMHSQNDRGAAITGGAFLEEALCASILKRWPPVSNTLHARVFTGYGPLSTFSARIDVATTMGVLHPEMRTSFSAIKSIRNKAAHVGTAFSFESNDIKSDLLKICFQDAKLFDRVPRESLERNQFTSSIKMLSAYLWFVDWWKEKFGHLAVLPPMTFAKAADKSLETKSSPDSKSGS